MDSQNVGQSVSDELRTVLSRGPVPQPTSDTQEYWDAAAQGVLKMPFCESCSRYFFYPRVQCRYCQSDAVTWREVSGRGSLLSFVINHKPFPEFETEMPQVIAIVELEEGVNILSQLAVEEPDPESLHLGMPLQVVFIERQGVTLPFFQLAADEKGV